MQKQTTIMITRPRHQAQELKLQLTERGAAVFEFPTLEIRPLTDYAKIDALLHQPTAFAWLAMTSANGVTMLAERARLLGIDLASRFAATQIAAVGPATASALEAAGLSVDLLAPQPVGEALAEALIATGVRGQRILTLRSQLAREVLPERLSAAGAEVLALPIYTTEPPTAPDIAAAHQALQNGRIDWVSFTSASAVRNFVACFDAPRTLMAAVRVACIGPITAAAARDLLGRADFVAQGATMAELAEGMLTPAGARP